MYLKKNLCVRLVFDYPDTWISLEYLRKNEKVRETLFACSYGDKVERLQQQEKMSQISWHCPLNLKHNLFCVCTNTNSQR